MRNDTNWRNQITSYTPACWYAYIAVNQLRAKKLVELPFRDITKI